MCRRRIIVDTGCDLREQLLSAEVDRVEAVLYTHEHADHTHGIDDLRVLALNNKRRVDVYFTAEAANRIVPSFAYCFTAPPGSGLSADPQPAPDRGRHADWWSKGRAARSPCCRSSRSMATLPRWASGSAASPIRAT